MLPGILPGWLGTGLAMGMIGLGAGASRVLQNDVASPAIALASRLGMADPNAQAQYDAANRRPQPSPTGYTCRRCGRPLDPVLAATGRHILC